MTEVPKLTPEQAAILRVSNYVPITVLMDLQHLGLTDLHDTPTELGKAALANFEAEREREIRRKAIDRCREWLRERMSEAECANNLIYADCIEDLIARFDSEVTP